MTLIDRQHNLTIRFVSMVSVMNIHDRQILRLALLRIKNVQELRKTGAEENFHRCVSLD